MPTRATGKTPIDLYIIRKVKEMRIQHGYSQAVLAVMLDVSATFISDIERPEKHQKYNLYHINQLAQIFKCSPRNFLPEQPII